MADYKGVQKGVLKLKGVSSGSVQKKKKKKKSKEKEELLKEEVIESKPEPKSVDHRTAAEIAFEKSRAKRATEEILERASKTHKDRIMEFNDKLDRLTEHYDIPKVSWTK